MESGSCQVLWWGQCTSLAVTLVLGTILGMREDILPSQSLNNKIIIIMTHIILCYNPPVLYPLHLWPTLATLSPGPTLLTPLNDHAKLPVDNLDHLHLAIIMGWPRALSFLLFIPPLT